MQRFVNDDAGYLSWLAAHPRGWVLNTYPHVTSAYLILHRAACRTVNRPLGPGRRWTELYGKSCGDDRRELETWALRETGKPVKPCAICLPGDGSSASAASVQRRLSAGSPRRGAGPRAPRTASSPSARVGQPIRVVIRPSSSPEAAGPGFAIEGAQWLAEEFFRRDPSAVGPSSYDSWIQATQSDPECLNDIVDSDVTAVNRTMAARMSHAVWATVISGNTSAWLQPIDPAWDLFDLDDPTWTARDVGARLKDAFTAVRRPGLNIAVITKVLHIKRPRLIPVLDRLVLDQIGCRVSDDVATWLTAVDAIRRIGRRNRAELGAIAQHLAAAGVGPRSGVRILDALLWTADSRSALYGGLDGWERVVRPAPNSTTEREPRTE